MNQKSGIRLFRDGRHTRALSFGKNRFEPHRKEFAAVAIKTPVKVDPIFASPLDYNDSGEIMRRYPFGCWLPWRKADRRVWALFANRCRALRSIVDAIIRTVIIPFLRRVPALRDKSESGVCRF
jgi:hypothetical protein